MTADAYLPRLEISNVWFSFSADQVPLLKDISLTLQTGDRACILGPSGVGKTTLLKLCSGLLLPSRGEICLSGERVERSDFQKSRALSQRMAMSFQKGGLLDCYDALENIDFALAELTDLSISERKKQAQHCLQQVGLSGTENRKLKELSGGMLKRLSLARVFSLQPSVLLLDDPTAGLDPVTSDEIMKIIEDYCSANRVILIFTTSELSVAFRLANRVGFLWEGALTCEESVQKFKTIENPAIRQFIRGEPHGPLTKALYA